tara:strand:+ start:645 stop:1901 length:1257 start_codon:yes stop_codon:yes gene_type:complete
MIESKRANHPTVVIINGSLRPIPSIGKNANGIGFTIEYLTQNIKSFDTYSISCQNSELNQLEFDKDKHIQVKCGFLYRIFYWIIFKLPFSLAKKLYGFSVVERQMYYNAVGKKIKELKPNIIISQTHYYLFNSVRKYYPEAIHIFHFRSSNLADWRIDILKDLYKNSDGLINVCHFAAKDVKKKHKLNHNNQRVIYNGVDNSLFKKNRNKNYINKFREKFGISENDFIFLYAGRMHDTKGIYEIVNAFRRLNEINHKTTLVLAGVNISDHDDDEIVRFLYGEQVKLGEDKLKIFEYLNNKDMPKILNITHCSLLCSKMLEGCSKFILESLSCGVPVIATNVGGNPEIIEDGINGLIINEDNLENNLYNALNRILNDKLFYKQLSFNAGMSIPRRYDMETLVMEYDRFLEDIWRNKVNK